MISHITRAANLIALDESYTKHYTNLHALFFILPLAVFGQFNLEKNEWAPFLHPEPILITFSRPRLSFVFTDNTAAIYVERISLNHMVWCIIMFRVVSDYHGSSVQY